MFSIKFYTRNEKTFKYGDNGAAQLYFFKKIMIILNYFFLF